MLISEYLASRSSISVTTGSVQQPAYVGKPQQKAKDSAFADELKSRLGRREVEFSGHAIKRLESRQIDVEENDRIERLNRGVEIAAEKGSEESLILVDSTAFIVSVKNNRVITTVSADDLKGNVFTNIDSTVII